MAPAGAWAVKAAMAQFIEHQEGSDPTRARVVVTPKYMRIDAGQPSKDFLLYDRTDRTIYNVNSLDATILVIKSRPLEGKSPIPLKDKVERLETQAPAVGGREVRHYRLHTNADLCYDLYAAEGLLPDVVTAMQEFRRALASEQAAVIAVTPKEFQTPCDLANNVYSPARHLAHGFPVRVTESTGRAGAPVRITELVDYRAEFDAAKQLFELPAGYRRLSIEQLSGR